MKCLYIVVPFTTLVICQIIKFFVEAFITKKLNLYRLINGAGGMPSSHSSFVTSITTIIGLNEGFDTVFFAISLIFSLVVMYDAMGVRYETGKQAEILNVLVKGNKTFKEKTILLKEKVGHMPVEVFCGCLLGIITASVFYYFI